MKHFLTAAWLVLATATITTCQSPEHSETAAAIDDCNVHLLIGQTIAAREIDRSYVTGRDPFGSGPIMSKIGADYERCKGKLSESEKLEYFWTLSWHVDFDGGLAKHFLGLVLEEVREPFLARLDHYIEIESEMTRNDHRLHKAKQVKKIMELMSEE